MKSIYSMQKSMRPDKSEVHLLIYSNKLAYLQLITVLVNGSSPFKSYEQIHLKFYQNPWKIRVNNLVLVPATSLKRTYF